MESAKRLIDDLSIVLDGVRKVVESRLGQQHEGKEDGRSGAEKHGGAKDLRQLAEKLGIVQSDLGGVVEDLRKSLERGMTKAEGGIRSALHEAAQFVQRHTKSEEEEHQAEGGEHPEAKERKAEGVGHPEGKQQKAEGRGAGGEKEAGHKLFDGNEASLKGWKAVGDAHCAYEEGALRIEAGQERGLVYFHPQRFSDFRLRLRYRPESPDFDARVAIRFLDPTKDVPDRDNPEVRYPYDNQAYVASHTGFEVLLGARQAAQESGTFPDVLLGDAPGAQLHLERGEVKSDDWNELELTVQGDCYSVCLNGKKTARFANTDSYRGKPSSAGSEAGFVGIVMKKGAVRVESFEVTEVAREQRQQAPAGEHPGSG